MQPIWVTVRVPRDAAPGEYQGLLTIESDLNKVPVIPVRIKVEDWTLPEPKDFRTTSLGLIVPDTVVKHYGVPLWSDTARGSAIPSRRTSASPPAHPPADSSTR